MRSITHVLLLVGACLLVNSCSKNDLPHKKLCQLTGMESFYTQRDYGRIFTYGYNNKHLLDSVTGRPSFNPQLALRIGIDYNAQSLPVFLRDYTSGFKKIIYQNGRIIRIDQETGANLYTPKYTYMYDFYGRVFKRISANDTLLWEYKGASRNFSKRIQLKVGAPPNSVAISEYRYDNELNPLAAWPNFPLNPFMYDLWDFEIHEYEPVPENNLVYQSFIARNSDGSLFTYQEIFYTYEYDDIYPVKAHIRQVQHSGTSPDQETGILNTYTYDCKNNSNGHF
jgi:hypothetical protein